MNEDDELKKANALREKAENILRKSNKNILPALVSEEDFLSLYHELEVYRVELELQNEDLLKANKISDEALEKYKDLYDFAPLGYYTLS